MACFGRGERPLVYVRDNVGTHGDNHVLQVLVRMFGHTSCIVRLRTENHLKDHAARDIDTCTPPPQIFPAFLPPLMTNRTVNGSQLIFSRV
jgi:hypothetical protein